MLLTTRRLILREFVPDDVDAVFAYQSTPEYLAFYDRSGGTLEDARRMVGWFLDWQKEEPRSKMQLAVTLKEDGRLIGCCGVRRNGASERIGEIGTEFAPAQWGKGYATEAVAAIVEYSFEILRLHRVWAHCIAENASAVHVLEKVGLRREVRLREYERFRGRAWDLLVYGMLEEEWRKRHGR
jgi:RimJ/RimL family protein N-acetyltransferase